MTPQEIVAELLRRGVELAQDGGDISLRSPAGALTPELRRGIAEHKSAILAIVGAGNRVLAPHAAVLRTLVLERRRPGDATLLRQSQMRIEGLYDATALGRAIDFVVERHEALRSHFAEIAGMPAMVMGGQPDAVVPQVVASSHEVDSWLDADATRPFDLGRAPLLRVAVVQQPNAHLIILTHHQLVADAWTTALIWRDLRAAYDASRSGGMPRTDAHRPDYLAAVRAEKAFEVSPACRAMTQWWVEELECAPVVPWPARTKERTGGYWRGTLGLAATQSLATLSELTSTTPFTVLLASFVTVLHCATGQRDISIGTPVANRDELATQRVAGYFSNLVVLRIDAAADEPFRQLVARSRQVTLAAWQRQRVPFHSLVGELVGDRGEAHNPLFQVMLNMADVPSDVAEGSDFQFLPVRGQWQPDVDLTLAVQPTKGGWDIAFYYNCDVLGEAEIRGFASALEEVLQAAATDAGRELSAMPLTAVPAPATKVDRAAQAIEARLLDYPDIRDAAVLRRVDSAGRERLVAYLARRVRTPLRRPDIDPEVDIVDVTSIPRDRRGQVIHERLAGMPVVSDTVLRRIESSFAGAVEPVKVLMACPAKPLPLLHELDLSPSWSPIDSKDTDRGAERQPMAHGAEAERPTIADGGPLVWPANAPRTLIEALVAAAETSWPGQVRHILANGEERADSWADILRDAGRIAASGPSIRRGEPVVISLDSTYETLRVYWAVLLAGGIPALLPLPSGSTAEAALDRLRACWNLLDQPVIITSRALSEQAQAAYSVAGGGAARMFFIDDAMAGPETLRPQDAFADEGDVALFSFTSGSTGTPKCIPLTHRNLIARALGAIARCELVPTDVTLNWLSFDHIGSMSDWHLRCVILRCQAIYADLGYVLRRPLRWLDILSTYKVTHSWAPNFAYGLLTRALREEPAREWDLHAVRSLLTAGENVSAATTSEFQQVLAPCGLRAAAVTPAYGMAELGSGVTYCPSAAEGGMLVEHVNRKSLGGRIERLRPDDPDAVTLVDAGMPIPGVAIRISDEKGAALSADTVGRLQVRGEPVFAGYYRNPVASTVAISVDGWFDTGDLGYLTNGRLVLAGRTKDILIINGANFTTSEIEAAVETAEGVAQGSAVIVPVSDRSGGETCGVFFAPASPAWELTTVLRNVRSIVSRHVGVDPEYLVPVERDDIPRTSIGKVRRAALRVDLLTGAWNHALRRADLALANGRTLPAIYHEVHWQAAEPVACPAEPRRTETVVFTDRSGLAADFITRAAPERVIHEGLEWRPAIEGAAPAPSAVDLVWFAIQWPRPDRGFGVLLSLLRSLAQQKYAPPVRLLVISSSSQKCRPDERLDPVKAALAALVRTAIGEMPDIKMRHVDICEGDPRAIDSLLRELKIAGNAPEVAWRDGVRHLRGLRRISVTGGDAAHQIPTGAVWVVLGGLGGIGLVLSEWLLTHHGGKLILCGRTDLDADTAAARRKRVGLATLQGLGEAIYLQGGVQDAALETRIRERLKGDSRPFGGVIDLTADYRRVLLADVTESDISDAVAARMASARLTASLSGSAGTAVGFSSIASMLGGSGLGPYAAACRAAEAAWGNMACAQPRIRSMSIAWPLWEGTGIGQNTTPQSMRAVGGLSLSRERALNVFHALFGSGRRHVIAGLDPAHPDIGAAVIGGPAPVRRPVVASRVAPDMRPQNDDFGTPVACAFVPLDTAAEPAETLIARIESPDGLVALGVAPRNDTERRLATLWGTVLRREVNDVRANFFELGGQSLLLTQLASRIQDEFSVDIPLGSLFDHATIEGMARLVLRQAARRKDPKALAELTTRLRALTPAQIGQLLAKKAANSTTGAGP